MLSQDQRLSPKGSGATRQGAPSGSKIRWPSLGVSSDSHQASCLCSPQLCPLPRRLSIMPQCLCWDSDPPQEHGGWQREALQP